MDKKHQKELDRKNKLKLKQYRKQLKSEIFDIDNEVKYNETDEALIECKIGKAENIFNKFDLAMERTITDEFEKYLLDEVNIIPIGENVAIKMYVDEEFTEENEKQVKKAIKRHFSFNITTDIVKMKRNHLAAIFLLLSGIICLVACPFISLITKDTYMPIYESMLILAWFFIWEGIGKAVFDITSIRNHRYNMLRLYNADISFERTNKLNANPQDKK